MTNEIDQWILRTEKNGEWENLVSVRRVKEDTRTDGQIIDTYWADALYKMGKHGAMVWPELKPDGTQHLKAWPIKDFKAEQGEFSFVLSSARLMFDVT